MHVRLKPNLRNQRSQSKRWPRWASSAGVVGGEVVDEAAPRGGVHLIAVFSREAVAEFLWLERREAEEREHTLVDGGRLFEELTRFQNQKPIGAEVLLAAADLFEIPAAGQVRVPREGGR